MRRDKHQLSNAPVMFTHWDAGMYPARPIPPVVELVINLLAYGHVVLKDVDLFMNEKIVSDISRPSPDALTRTSNWDVFASLIRTKRITILTADPSRGLDPNCPILSAAEDHQKNRTFAGDPWQKFDEARKHWCSRLDDLCIPLGICKPRQTPPAGKNTFSELLGDVLADSDTTWRKRPQFLGITQPITEQFAEFCSSPERAIEFLERNGRTDIPGRDQGFYRTRLYQCVGVLERAAIIEPQQGDAMKNLAQSIFAACETNREQTVGTYFGKMAECPNPYVKPHGGSYVDIRVVPKRQKHAIKMVSVPEIGEIVNETLENCGPMMEAFWKVGAASSSPEERFRLAWTRVADEFAKVSARRTLARFQPTIRHRWHRITSSIHCVLWLSDLGLLGFKLLMNHQPGDVREHLLQGADAVMLPTAAVLGATVLGEAAENWIRLGYAEAKLIPSTRDTLIESAATRAGTIPPPIGYLRGRSGEVLHSHLKGNG